MRRTIFVLPVELAPVVQAGCTRAIAARERRNDRAVPGRGRRHRRPGAPGWPGSRPRPWPRCGSAARRCPPTCRPRCPSWPSGSCWPAARRTRRPRASRPGCCRCSPRTAWWCAGGRAGAGIRRAVLVVRAGRVAARRPARAGAGRGAGGAGPGLAVDVRPGAGDRPQVVAGWTLGQTRAALPRSARSRSTSTARPGSRCPTTWPRSRPPSRTRPCCRCSTRPRWAGRTAAGTSGRTATALFDTNGNAGPTVWWDGRIVGGWAQRKSGEVVLRFLEDAGADAVAAAEEQAGRLQEWLGPARITPRFRTPLERELVA